MKLTQKEYDELWNLQQRLQNEATAIRAMLAQRDVVDETGKNFP